MPFSTQCDYRIIERQPLKLVRSNQFHVFSIDINYYIYCKKHIHLDTTELLSTYCDLEVVDISFYSFYFKNKIDVQYMKNVKFSRCDVCQGGRLPGRWSMPDERMSCKCEESHWQV